MPLPPEVLEKIKEDIERGEALIKSVEDVIADLRASGIDASKQEEKLREAKDSVRQMRSFYQLQIKRGE